MHDLDTGDTVTLPREDLSLSEFVTRGDALFLADDVEGGFFRLDLDPPALRQLPLDVRVRHVARLPERDRLLLRARSRDDVYVFDPAREVIERAVQPPR